MECPFCNQYIDDDSFFCDQCGQELMVCPVCKKPGKGKACIYDGNKLVAAKSLSQPTTSNSDSPVAKNIATTIQSPVQQYPRLLLTNAKLGIQVSIADSDIVGRKSGNHVKAFENLNQISGAHAQFNYTNGRWMVTDLNSTNGTKIAQQQRNWDAIESLIPNKPEPINPNGFLLLANIEFQVVIELPDKSDKTQRINE